jgi:hypothetical protein
LISSDHLACYAIFHGCNQDCITVNIVQYHDVLIAPAFFWKSSWLIGEDGADGLILCVLYPDENAVLFLGGQDM